MPAYLLSQSLAAKILEQLERTERLVHRIPAAALDWTPPYPRAMTTVVLLGHLLDCLAGFCAVLAAAEPFRLEHFANLRTLRVNHSCPPAEAIDRIGHYRAYLQEGFALLSDDALARKLPTVFVKEGETVLTLLLGNLEHLINHKFQLFLYLKLQGVPLATEDLYQFRTDSN